MKLTNLTPDDLFLCLLGILTAIFLRLCTSLHPYSGQHKQPMYGDYEAQRHWMEITVNLPMNQWYHHNTTSNDLNYWGLDYPPLTAYHSYINGLVAHLINPDYVELVESKGYESEEHKLFMRYTVLISDLLVYIPFAVAYCFLVDFGGQKLSRGQRKSYLETKANLETKALETKTYFETKSMFKKKGFGLKKNLFLCLLYPGLILIDHGHFQYNCVSLGLTIGATIALQKRLDICSCILFVLALNYKQIALYHAFPFFLQLLSACIPKPGAKASTGIIKFAKLSLTVIGTFAILWLPFLFDLRDTLQVVHRLFPLSRGVFEDKVANVWCTLNVYYKFKQNVCSERMIKYCTIATLSALLPSSADLFLRPSIEKFVPALVNSALAFFLFSYQVHEKSILFAAIPVLLLLPRNSQPLACFWFLYLSTFSMLPLLIKDGLVIAYISLTGFYAVTFALCFESYFREDLKLLWASFRKFLKESLELLKNDEKSLVFLGFYKYFVKDLRVFKIWTKYLAFFGSLLGSFALTLGILVLEPPIRYPDLYTVLISSYSCLHFFGFFVYFHFVQFSIPQNFDYLVASENKPKQL